MSEKDRDLRFFLCIGFTKKIQGFIRDEIERRLLQFCCKERVVEIGGDCSSEEGSDESRALDLRRFGMSFHLCRRTT